MTRRPKTVRAETPAPETPPPEAYETPSDADFWALNEGVRFSKDDMHEVASLLEEYRRKGIIPPETPPPETNKAHPKRIPINSRLVADALTLHEAELKFNQNAARLLDKLPRGEAIAESNSKNTTAHFIEVGYNPPTAIPQPAPELPAAPVARRDENPTIMESSLINLFKTRNLPESMWPDTAAEIERIVNERAKAALRPKWDERGKYDELKNLSSPAFLKRVYADEMAPDGSIAKEAVRKTDPKLLAIVTAYISEREGRRQDMGEAEGLRLIAGPRGRPKRASLG